MMVFSSSKTLLLVLLTSLLLREACSSFQFYCHRLEEAGRVKKVVIIHNGVKVNEENPVILSTCKSTLQCYWKAEENIRYNLVWTHNNSFDRSHYDYLGSLSINVSGLLPDQLSKFTVTMPACYSVPHNTELPANIASNNKVKMNFFVAGNDSESASSPLHSVNLLLQRECAAANSSDVRMDCPMGFTGTKCQERILEFVARPKNLRLECVETAVFSCVASGLPLPAISWYRHNTTIVAHNNTRYRIVQSTPGISSSQSVIAQHKSEITSSTLYLYRIQQSDFGYYSCMIRNNMGWMIHHAYLSPPPLSSCYADDQ